MSVIKILAGPAVGAVIGFITNYIAIKMVFRPLEPKYVFGFRIPFTPGIVPRRKDELSESLAQAVFAKFFNWDDLETVFMSEPFIEATTDRICDVLRSDIPLCRIQKQISEETANVLENALARMLNERILAHGIIEKVISRSCDVLNGTEESPGKGLLIGQMLSAYRTPITEMMEVYLKEDGNELFMSILADERKAVRNETVGDISREIWKDDKTLRKGIRTLYQGFMAQNVRAIVESIDIVAQITEKVKLMHPAEIEDIVQDVISKELSLVVFLGGLLGMIIGAVNIFI